MSNKCFQEQASMVSEETKLLMKNLLGGDFLARFVQLGKRAYKAAESNVRVNYKNRNSLDKRKKEHYLNYLCLSDFIQMLIRETVNNGSHGYILDDIVKRLYFAATNTKQYQGRKCSFTGYSYCKTIFRYD